MNRYATTFLRHVNYFITIHSFKGAGRIVRFLKRIVMHKIKDITNLIKLPVGFSMYVNPIYGGAEEALYFKGVYEAGTLYVLKSCLREKDIFFDVGSNIGLISLFAAKQVDPGLVYSFEPLQESFCILEQNIKVNNCKKVRAYNLAIGQKREKREICWGKNQNRGQAYLKKLPTKREKTEEGYFVSIVDVISLDEFISIEHIDRVDMLKIDVEGWELEVLRGAKNLLSKKESPMICVEYSKNENDEQILSEIYDYLIGVNKYKIYKLEKGKEKISKLSIVNKSQLPQHDNLFCFLPEHERRIKSIIKT